VLSSNDADGILFTDTCNLDGETNLKVRHAIPQLLDQRTAAQLGALRGVFTCDTPNNRLYTFNGCLTLDGQQISVDNNEVLLRGCNLRNTDYANGVVVYTGAQSKLMMNSSAARAKRSNLERSLNPKLATLFTILIVWSIVAGLVGVAWQQREVVSGHAWYMFYAQGDFNPPALRGLLLIVSNLVIINAIIPISLYVTLELVRVFQAQFVSWDKDMWDEESGTGAVARTSNISDDLGQIEYVFSDKTGTLTRNVMEFRKCSIGGAIYGKTLTEIAYQSRVLRGQEVPAEPGEGFQDEEFLDTLRTSPTPVIKHFLWLLSTSHAVIPEPDPRRKHGINFQASSPDEAALVSAAADFGYLFTGRTSEAITVNINGEVTEVPVLANLEFTSERKRSSVIIRRPDSGEIVLYCKGADDLIFARLADGPREETLDHLKRFAAEGLRTLCCAYRVLEEDSFRDWYERYNQAACEIVDRDQKVNDVANEVESGLTLIGATAIEDKLQNGVPATISALMEAKINVWVITGDKRETAINIGFSCGLLTSDTNVVVLDYSTVADIDAHWPDVDEDPVNVAHRALVVSGAALEHLLGDALLERFYLLTKRFQAVVACRVSPLQKATIVRMIRTRAKRLTLAIGDGANDVGMIMEADVGIGISGKEGRQAVLASDYSFAQFKYLQQLLFVHGRINFYRNVELVNYSFYKNIVFSFANILFQFFSQFSGNTLYNPTLYTVFNVLFTSVPPVIYAALERDVSKRSMIECPILYYWDGERDRIVGYPRFLLSLGLGVAHSVIAFFVPYFGLRPFIDQTGRSISLGTFGITVYAVVVVTVNIRIATMCHFWTIIHHIFIWGSIIIYPLVVIVLSVIDVDPTIYQTGYFAFTTSSFWLSVLTASLFTIWPVVAIETFRTGRDRMVNRVVQWTRKDDEYKARVPLHEIVKEFVPVKPVPVRDGYVDPTNMTGSIMDAPEGGENNLTLQRLRTRRTITQIPQLKPSIFSLPE
jgi:phospholipid-translocating P-type ATPase (flippase)